MLIVEIKEGTGGSLMITDGQGRVVKEERVKGDRHQIDVSALASGYYQIRFTCPNGYATARFVKR